MVQAREGNTCALRGEIVLAQKSCCGANVMGRRGAQLVRSQFMASNCLLRDTYSGRSLISSRAHSATRLVSVRGAAQRTAGGLRSWAGGGLASAVGTAPGRCRCLGAQQLGQQRNWHSGPGWRLIADELFLKTCERSLLNSPKKAILRGRTSLVGEIDVVVGWYLLLIVFRDENFAADNFSRVYSFFFYQTTAT